MNKKILLADRSSSLERIVVEALAREAVDVTAVTDGYAAERSLNDNPPDLVFADVFLLGKSGYELCQSIKQNPQLSGLPVILLVGSFEPFDAAEAKRVGADGKLAKPIEPTGLIEIVRRFMGGGGSPSDVRDPVLTAIPVQAPVQGLPDGVESPAMSGPSPTQPMAGGASWEGSQSRSTQCKNHFEVPAVGRCAGCAEPFCANCMVEVHGQKYCGQCKVLALQGRTVVAEATTPCAEAAEALKYALISLFCFGFYFGPKAISKAMTARNLIDADPMLTGSGKANAALVIGIIGLVLWVLGLLFRLASIGSR